MSEDAATPTPDATPTSASDAPQDAGGVPAADATPSSAPEPIWREDWRQQMAGDDAKALKQLERFNAPTDVYTAFRSAQQKISSGELQATLPENATPEQIAEYREARGIPADASGYHDALSEAGIVIGENDKPHIDNLFEAMHAKNHSPAVVNDVLEWYYGREGAITDQLAEADAQIAQSTEDTLRSEWGNDYRTNMNHLENWLATGPEGLRDILYNARGEDGARLKDNPDVMRWLSLTARENNPLNMVLPAGAGDRVSTLEARKSEIEGMMRSNRQAYDKDAKVQQEYREILTALERAA